MMLETRDPKHSQREGARGSENCKIGEMLGNHEKWMRRKHGAQRLRVKARRIICASESRKENMEKTQKEFEKEPQKDANRTKSVCQH